MSKRYPPNAVANEFIELAGSEGVSHMKLQKLIYLTLERWLLNHDESFLTDDPQVWQYGPVFPRLYHELKYHGREPITQMVDVFGAVPRVDDPALKRAIREVWDRYGSKSAIVLSDLTHRPGSPWRNVAARFGFKVPMGTAITAPDIIQSVRNLA